MKSNRDFQIDKTGYNYRTRKERDIMAFIYDADGKLLNAVNPGTGNHRATLDWAEWRAESIRKDYPAAVRMVVHCGDDEIAVVAFAETPSHAPATKSINDIMNQANRLMVACNAVRNFKRADAIRAIAFRYYDNIRACVGRFNYNDDGEYNKEYSRAQYMNA